MNTEAIEFRRKAQSLVISMVYASLLYPARTTKLILF